MLRQPADVLLKTLNKLKKKAQFLMMKTDTVLKKYKLFFLNRFVKYRFNFASVEQTGSCQVSKNILRVLPCCLLLRIHQLQSRKCVIICQMFPRVDTELSLQVSYLRSEGWDGEALWPVTKTFIAHWFDPLIGLMHWQPGWVDRGGHKPL